LSCAQISPVLRQPIWQVPAAQPSPVQHSLDAVQEEVCGRQGAGWQVPDGHWSPAQQSLEPWQFWPWSAQPMRGAHLLSVQVPEQHWLGELQKSSAGRQPDSHWPWLQRRPEQQSRLVEQTPLGSGLQAQTPGVFWNRSPQPKEQHSSWVPHVSPTCLQNARDRQLQPERVARSARATAASQRPCAFVLIAAPPRRGSSTTASSRPWW
jgi:hypothetical protein